jgi:hypothetical protein
VFTPSWQQKILLIVDVGGFEKDKASHDFERTLEVVASLAVSMIQKGVGVGLITNGSLDGKPMVSAAVPVMNHAGTLPAILEVLARVQMKTAEPLKKRLKNSFTIPGGVSCILFSFTADKANATTCRSLAQKRIPVICIVARRDEAEKTDTRVQGKLICCDDLRLDTRQ